MAPCLVPLRIRNDSDVAPPNVTLADSCRYQVTIRRQQSVLRWSISREKRPSCHILSKHFRASRLAAKTGRYLHRFCCMVSPASSDACVVPQCEMNPNCSGCGEKEVTSSSNTNSSSSLDVHVVIAMADNCPNSLDQVEAFSTMAPRHCQRM